MATPRTRRCIGSARFGIEPHEAPVKDFPKQPSQPDGLGRMCAEHWKAYVKALTADRKARATTPEPSTAEPATAIAKRERRRTPKTDRPAANPEPPRVGKARQVMAVTETLTGPADSDAVGSDEVQAVFETLNGHDHAALTPEYDAAIEAVATESDPRSEEVIRALE